MSAKSIIYWTTTALLAAGMTASARLYLTRNRTMMKQFESLDYPDYFPAVLGTSKLLGVAALASPRHGLLKEWAYAGFTFTFLGAAASHLAKGQKKEAVAPLIALSLMAASYLSRPADRRLKESPRMR